MKYSPATRLQSRETSQGLFLWMASGSLMLCSTLGCAQPSFIPKQPIPGTMDLSDWEVDRLGMVSLDGLWAFYPKEFVSPEELQLDERQPDYFLQVPGTWNALVLKDLADREPGREGQPRKVSGQPVGASLFGTYHLRVQLPPADGIFALRVPSALSAYDLWVDGQLLTSVGKPGEQASTTQAQYIPRSALFSPAAQSISLVVHISNFHHRSGGLYRPILVGSDRQLIAHERHMVMTDVFVLASIAVMAGYHLIHFCYRRQDIASLYFALGCIAMMFWQASINERLIRELVPDLSGKAALRVEYCAFFAAVAFLTLFLHATFTVYYPKFLAWIISVVSLVFTAVVLSTSMLTASRLLPIFQAFTLLGALITILLLARARWLNVPLAGYILVGMFVFIATYLHDIFYTYGWVQTTWLSSYGLVFLVVVISMTMSVRFKKAFNHVNQLKITFEKFVPKRFLLRITDEDLSSIELGNAHGESIVVLFSDIRGFTAISEQLGPADLLEYLNLYFLEMATVVKRNGGFIDKFIGDAVMALFDEQESDTFPSACSRALKAATEMQLALPELNARLARKNWPPIRIGVGMHFGPVVMGTVGAEFRMDSTVLGDTVNTAARLESLTKQHQASIILSRALWAQLPDGHAFTVREIGTVAVPGKQEPVQIFELVYVLPDPVPA